MLFEYETERLFLKIVRPDYAEQVLDFYLRDKELFERYETDRIDGFYTLNTQRQLVGFDYNAAVKGTLFRYYVYRRENPKQMIGTICFHRIQMGYYLSCEIGYKFSSEYHHRGYATEAMRCIVDAIFRELKLHRITAWVLEGNSASVSLLRRVGFSYEGHCRDYLFLHGEWRDYEQYSILASDYLAGDQSQSRRHIQ